MGSLPTRCGSGGVVVEEVSADEYQGVSAFLSGGPIVNWAELDGGVEGGGDGQPVQGVEVTVDLKFAVQPGGDMKLAG